MKKIIIYLVFLIPFIVTAQSEDTLDVVIPLTRPYAFFSDSGTLTGFDAALIQFLKKNGILFKIHHDHFEEAINGVESGKYDFALGGIYVTAERKKRLSFTIPYLYTGVILLSTRSIMDYDDLNGLKIGVKRGATGEYLLGQLVGKYKITPCKFLDSQESLLALERGEIDAVITDFYNGLYYLNKMKISDVNIFPPSGFLQSNAVAIPVNKKNTELVSILNSLLNDFMNEPEFEQLHQKWFGISYSSALKRAEQSIDYLKWIIYSILTVSLLFSLRFIWILSKNLKQKQLKEKQILEIASIYNNLFKHIPQGIVIISNIENSKPAVLIENGYFAKIRERIRNALYLSDLSIETLLSIIDRQMPVDLMQDVIRAERLFSRTFKFNNLHINIIGINLPENVYALVLTDQSLEKSYKEALRESQEKYKLAFHSLGEGVIWVAKDKIREINPAAAEIFGHKQADILGKSVVNFISYQKWKLYLHELEENDAGIVYDEIEVGTHRKSTLHLTITSLEDKQDNYLILLRDVSGEKENLERITYLKSFNESMLKFMPSSIFALDEGGKIIEINESALKFWNISDREQIVGKSIWETIAPLKIFEGYFNQLWDSKEEIFLYKVPVSVDSERRFFNITLYPIILNNKFITIFKHDDITQEVRLDEQLKQAQKMEIVGELAGGMVHDFNNILAAISGTLSVMEAELKLKASIPIEKLKRQINTMNLAISKAGELVQKLLVIGRRHDTKKELVDIQETLMESVDIVKSMIPKHIKLKVNVPPFPLFIVGDALHIQQVVINLVKNAVDAMGDKTGNIDVILAIEPDAEHIHLLNENLNYISLKIKDNGPGIPDNILDKIFEPFFTTKPKGKGTGLGLSIVYNLIKELDGEIVLDSAPQHGTEFTIYLPKVNELEMSSHFGQEEEDVPYGTGRILVVDDDEVIRVVSHTYLELSGFEVMVAEDGQAAYNLCQQENFSFDAIVMDLIMPNMNGYDTYFKIKNEKKDIPIIIATAFKNDHLAQELLKNGAETVIQKPFDRKTLVSSVLKAINKN